MQAAPVKPTISFDLLNKIDVRVGTIESVEDVPRSDKMVKLTVDFGDHRRSILVGMKEERDNPWEIEGKQALFVVNLEPKKMMGEVSEWMLFDIGYDDYLRSVKTAMLFQEWMEEAGEDKLLEGFRVTPGELRVRLGNADWLLYSMQELGLLLGHMDTLKDLRKLRVRVSYGVREELLPLVRLKGVGRVRARVLHSSGLRSLEDLRRVPQARRGTWTIRC